MFWLFVYLFFCALAEKVLCVCQQLCLARIPRRRRESFASRTQLQQQLFPTQQQRIDCLASRSFCQTSLLRGSNLIFWFSIARLGCVRSMSMLGRLGCLASSSFIKDVHVSNSRNACVLCLQIFGPCAVNKQPCAGSCCGCVIFPMHRHP